VLGLAADSIGVDESFFDLGGDSITSLRIVAKARSVGLKISVRQVFTHPTIEDLAAVAVYESTAARGEGAAGGAAAAAGAAGGGDSDLDEPDVEVVADDESAALPFPLIGIQKAYYIGIQLSVQESDAANAVQPIIFNEFEVKGGGGGGGVEGAPHQRGVDVARLEAAWWALVRRHDMLRAVVTDAGNLVIEDREGSGGGGGGGGGGGAFAVEVVDLSGEVGGEDEQLRREEDQRNRTIARPLTVHEWPLFECAVVRLPGGIDRVQVKLSLVLLDALSEMTLRRELETLYEDIDAALPPIGVRFRDYAIALSDGLAKTKAYQKDVDHWMGRLDGLPGPPALPLLLGDGGGGDSGATGRFLHIAGSIDRDQWRNLRRLCAKHKMTATATLCSVFALALAAWAPNSRDADGKVLINVMHTMRLPVHEHISRVFGNFSSTSLLAAPVGGAMEEGSGGGGGGGGKSGTFRELAAALAEQLAADLEHWRFGGVDVARALNARRSKTLQAVAPYVFTSTLGLETESLHPRGLCKDMHFTCVTTPHVYVDHQVVEEAGSLAYYFDVAEGIFAAEVVTGLVETYRALLEKLCESGANWGHPVRALLPEASAVAPYRATAPIDDRLLQDPLAEKAAAAKDSLAVVEGATRLSYGELENLATVVASRIAERVVGRRGSGEEEEEEEVVVAVLMEKGWRQVVAVMGVLRAGAAYLPMDPKLPEARQKHIVEASGKESESYCVHEVV
jgi:aryl carrier-like protein